MIDRLPSGLRTALLDPTAWISAGHQLRRGSAAHQLLLNLWQVLAGELPNSGRDCVLLIARGRRPFCRVERFGRTRAAIVISQPLIDALVIIASARTAYFQAGADAGVRGLARHTALNLAQSYRRHGRVEADVLELESEASGAATSAVIVGLSFLVLHEAAHLELGHVSRKPQPPLPTVEHHAREFTADERAAVHLMDLGLSTEVAGPALQTLFDLLHLLAFGVPGYEKNHPLPMARLLRVLAIVDPITHEQERRRLGAGGRDSWYLSS